jgi:1-acyl-sn-glycerol-3-phosphate acyltransferase
MFRRLKDLLAPPLPERVRRRLREDAQVNSAGFDPWGLNLDTAERVLALGRWIYEVYFRVETHGIENIPAGRCMLVPNHGGQLPLDGFFVAMAAVLEADPPRMVRGMVERWFPSLPFISTLFTRCGQVVGDPHNCIELLKRDQTIMVFPEGVGGSGKTYWHRYSLQRFGTGFVRIALQTQCPIVPVAVVGAEEIYPSIYNAAWLAKLLGIPYVPVTPFWPALGPLGAVPIPMKIDLYFGEPILFEGDPDAPDSEIARRVDEVKARIQEMIDVGIGSRPELSALNALPGGRRAHVPPPLLPGGSP